MADPGWGEEGVTTIRAGLGLGAVAGVLAGLAPRWDMVEGASRDTPGVTKVLAPGGAVGGFGVLLTVFLVAVVFVPRLWAWLAGLGLITGLAGACGLVVITGRTSDDFAADADVSLLTGGRLLVVAFWVGMVAVAVILVGFRKMALAPRPAAEGEDAEGDDTEGEDEGPGPRRGRSRTGSGKATLSFALGVGGFAVVIASSLAVAIGALALGDIRASDGRKGGRGLAIAGLVLGIVALCLLAALVGVGTLAATPNS